MRGYHLFGRLAKGSRCLLTLAFGVVGIAFLGTICAGCGGRTVGGNWNGTHPGDGGGADAAVTDGHVPDSTVRIWGTIGLNGQFETTGTTFERLSLHAAFYRQPQNPDEPPGFVESGETPNGVLCDIYYMRGLIDDPPPEPPQIDSGEISAFTSWAPDDRLIITFDGQRYEVDSRTPFDPDNPMPGWLVREPVAVVFQGEGSVQVVSFTQEVILSSRPAILVPASNEQPIPLEPDGTYRIVWEPVESESTHVNFYFNLDWDNSAFLCRPPTDTVELLLPGEWIEQWTWGSGEIVVVAQNETTVLVEDAQITIRAGRAHKMRAGFGTR